MTARERVDRFQEFVRLLDLALTDDHVTFAGDLQCHRHAAGRRIGPGADSVATGRKRPRSVRFAARHGDGWITTGTQAGNIEDWFAELHAVCASSTTPSPAGPEATGFPPLSQPDLGAARPPRGAGRSTI